MNTRMIMFIIFLVAMGLSFIGKTLITLDSAFDLYEALNKIFQSLAIKVSIVCICYFMFF